MTDRQTDGRKERRKKAERKEERDGGRKVFEMFICVV